MQCHVEDVCRRMLIFPRKVLKDRGKADTMSASAKPCLHGFWTPWMVSVGGPVMMRTAVSLFNRNFTPGDVTSSRDVPFAVGVRGVYGNPTLRAMHPIHKCVAKGAPLTNIFLTDLPCPVSPRADPHRCVRSDRRKRSAYR